jgi:PAT family beta-lactamase induction signal transducer AmpG
MIGHRLPLYLQPRMLLMFALGFGSGLPLLLTGSTLLAWLTGAGVHTAELGLFSLCSLPYSLKVLWAPLVDRLAPLPRLGRRRGWILGTQLLLLFAICALGCVDPTRAPLLTAGRAVLVATVSATQDIAVDAYRTDLLPAEQAAAGTATFVFGYRVAMVVAGALALRLADRLGGNFQRVYFLLAAGLVPAMLATLLAPAPPGGPETTRGFAQTVVAPLRDFFQRPGALLVLGFVMLYRLSDMLAAMMLTPFLLQVGYTYTQVADATKLVGLLCSILGALGGGVLVQRQGLRRSLYLFGILQSVANLGYVAIAHRQAAALSPARSLPLLYGAVAVDTLCTGLVVAASGAFLIGQCNRRFSATQMALLTSASGVLARLLGGGSGFFIARWGWEVFLLCTVVIGLPALGVLRRLEKTGALSRTQE